MNDWLKVLIEMPVCTDRTLTVGGKRIKIDKHPNGSFVLHSPGLISFGRAYECAAKLRALGSTPRRPKPGHGFTVGPNGPEALE